MTFEQRRPRALRDAYRFPGFTPRRAVRGVDADPVGVVVTLHPRKQSAYGVCGMICRTGYDQRLRHVRDLPCGVMHVRLAFALRRVACRTCGGVKQVRLDWLADNPHYTRRFALYVGKQSRGASIREVAEDLRLDGHAAKAMDTLSMRAQLDVAGP